MSQSSHAVFGSGCFWCGEALFRQLRGVHDVVSGYAGGTKPDPTYEEVCSGTTGHAEVFQVAFDPSVITYAQLVEVFFLTHDPTSLNRQGHDVGTQYRSAIFTIDQSQHDSAVAVRDRLIAEGAFDQPVVTEITPLERFYPAEAYHQRYFEHHPEAAYCQFVIGPKLAKFKHRFTDLLAA